MLETIRHDTIRELRLNRPPANALDSELLQAIADSVRQAPGDGAEAVVLSGSPGLFSGGLDLPRFMALDRDGLRGALDAFFAAMEALAGSEIPVAAAITGHSPAGGAVLALFCDWRVMAAGEYRIGFNEVAIGIPMPRVVIGLIERTVGRRVAERLCVTGELVAAETALRLGVVDELVAQDEVIERAVDWCRTLISLPSAAVEPTRRLLRSDLVELLTREKHGDIERLAKRWFEPGVQRPLQALARKLAGD